MAIFNSYVRLPEGNYIVHGLEFDSHLGYILIFQATPGLVPVAAACRAAVLRQVFVRITAFPCERGARRGTMYPPVIKHGWLENGPFFKVIFQARNLHS